MKTVQKIKEITKEEIISGKDKMFFPVLCPNYYQN
jgi:hypothetical protein